MNFLKNLTIMFLSICLLVAFAITFVQSLDKTMDNQEKSAKKYVEQLDPHVIKSLKK